MTKTLKITIISTVIILIFGLIGFLFFYQNKGGDRGIDIIKNTLPFGYTPSESSEITPVETTSDSDEITGGWTGDISEPKLFQLHKEAIAGSYLFKRDTNKNNINKTIARYIERGVGHIFETNMNSLEEERISNTTRLKIHEAIWGNNGKNVIIRYLDDENEETIRSFVITLRDSETTTLFEEETPTETTPQETEGVFLPENITGVALSEENDKKIFYLFELDNSSVGTIYNLENGKMAQIFQSPFTEWLPQWPNKDIITLTTKPSEKVPGFMYFLDTETERLVKVLNNIDGLTTLTSPDVEKVLYSESTKGWVSLSIYDKKEHSSKELPLSTLPEKCVWSKVDKNIIYCAVPNNPKRGSYPDQWYQGLISFSDDIWAINTKTYTTERILSPRDTIREEFDIIKLQIDKNDEFISFTNKKDLSLWSIKLPKEEILPFD